MRIVTGEEMRHIDRVTIEERGIPGLHLMEQAGGAVADLILDKIRPGLACVVTGKGNNAGDGFVTARLLHKEGIKVRLLMLAPEDDLSGDALSNFRSLPPEIPRFLCKTPDELASYLDNLGEADCIVDAILGTGIKGEVRGLFAEAIELINGSPAWRVAVDIPSGMPADKPYFDALCIRADYTITMGLPKLGMVQYPAAGYCGELIVAPLGFPQDLVTAPMESKCQLITRGMVKARLPRRPPDAHKGTFGTVLIMAGSPGMTGAAAMTALAAARSGTGLVFVAIPRDLNPILEVKLTEPLTMPLPTEEPGIPDAKMLPGIMEKAEISEAVALGPGMGRAPQTRELIHKLLPRIEKPLVLDADGINAFEPLQSSGQDNPLVLLKNRKYPTILTPHPGELSRLTGISASEIQKDRLAIARRFSSEYGVILVLKGAGTIIAEPGGEVFISLKGSTSLSKGGSGDILTGLVAGFLAQGLEPVDAAVSGVYLHGLAGELAAEIKTERAALPGDVIDQIPEAVKSL